MAVLGDDGRVSVLRILGLVAVIVAWFWPGPFDWARHTPAETAQRVCYASQRVLLGAIEMYDQDHPGKPLTVFDASTVEELRRLGYLHRPETLTCFRPNRSRQTRYSVEMLLSLVFPLYSPVPGNIEGFFPPGSSTLHLRCRTHGSPDP
ncbi:MAG: hypothetical protein GX442_21065 [Candidatus Riflebacteria bacterium]|nr:hypothetical protein [Candidatus Riflebacteria bacterium]